MFIINILNKVFIVIVKSILIFNKKISKKSKKSSKDKTISN